MPAFAAGTSNTSNGLIIANTGGTYIRLHNIDCLTCSNVTVTALHATAPNSRHTFDDDSS